MKKLASILCLCVIPAMLSGCASSATIPIDTSALIPEAVAHKLILQKFGEEPTDYSKVNRAFVGIFPAFQNGKNINICIWGAILNEKCFSANATADEAKNLLAAFRALGAPINQYYYR